MEHLKISKFKIYFSIFSELSLTSFSLINRFMHNARLYYTMLGLFDNVS